MDKQRKVNHVEKYSNEDKFIYKIIGDDAKSGNKAWWIVRIHPKKLAQFRLLIPKGHLDLADFGEILDSGLGRSIPEEFLRKHGFRLY
ncbi:MAG: hypothetical protein CMO55_00785 [Verrucomicrobiales bacterium]|nr:hypothetical protein [Verrucomicrobiales bacterium]